MNEYIPSKIVRKIIFDILFERANIIDNTCNKIIKEEGEQIGVNTEYSSELGTTACGTRILADDILEGIISIEEAVDVLTQQEKKEAKLRCQKWLKEKGTIER